MPCIDCAHGSLRDAHKPDRDRTLKAMAKRGFVNCGRSDHGASFHPAEHECSGWAALPVEAASARRDWLKKNTPD